MILSLKFAEVVPITEIYYKSNTMKFSLLFVLIAFTFTLTAQDLQSFYKAGTEAYEQKDYEGFLKSMLSADSLRPNHPALVYNIAAGYSLVGDHTKALKAIKKSLLMNTGNDFAKDEDFTGIKDTDGFQKLMDFRKELNQSLQTSKVAFAISEKDLHPESIAYNPKSNKFYLGSVHKSKIVEYDPSTKQFKDWKSSGEDGLWAVMGMKVDEQNCLWVCTVATQEMETFQSENEGKTAVFKYNLKNGKLIQKYELEGGHWFGDLVIHPSGDVYISDSIKPILYKISKEKDQLEVFEDFSGRLMNLQGLSFGATERDLYLSDYISGIYKINIENKSLIKLNTPKNALLKGVDGMYYYDNSLIAIHNGLKPNRVIKYKLNDLGDEIESFTYIDKAREELNEPTLGVIVEDSFYYVANSPWWAYDKEGNLDTSQLGDNIILKHILK